MRSRPHKKIKRQKVQKAEILRAVEKLAGGPPPDFSLISGMVNAKSLSAKQFALFAVAVNPEWDMGAFRKFLNQAEEDPHEVPPEKEET